MVLENPALSRLFEVPFMQSLRGPRLREVVTDFFMEDGTKHRQRSTTAVDGGKAWKEAVEGNKFSFEQVYKMNLATDVSKTADLAAAAHADLAAVLLAKNLAVQ